MSESTSDKLFAKFRINRFGKKNDSNYPSTSEEFQSNQTNGAISDQQSQNSHAITPDIPCISQTFEEAVRDSVALASLINFLESTGQLPLLKFWLHVEALLSNLSQSSPASTIADAVNIVSTYLTISVIPISAKICNKIKDEVHKAQTIGTLNPQCFMEAQNHIGNLLVNRYFKEFLRSQFYARYNLEMLQSGRFSLEDILRSHRLLCGFIEFLETENQRQLLEFVIAVDSFVSQLGESHAAKSTEGVNFQDDAMVIYDRYFSMQATEPLGFGDEIRIEIESNICTQDGIPQNNAFEKPRQIVAHTLQKKLIPIFLESAHFKKILSELEQALTTYHYTNHTSVKEVSQKPNGYSAQDRPSCDLQRRPTFSTNDEDSDEETRSQSSATFQTPKQSCLKKSKLNSLAKVDQLGRYKPLFDSSLCSNSDEMAMSARGRLKNTLDKYLNQSAAKEKLAAEEIAELIISDVRQTVERGNHERRQYRTKYSNQK